MMLAMRRLGWLAVVGGAVVLAVLATWFALDLLLGEANQAGAGQRAAARIDAIRTGLTVAAGAGALFALGLALRRQWYTEHDSRERRITELYVQSVEQLGSERVPVRLGGLYALARLGQGNPDHRQTVMDVLCGYRRMPFDEKEATDELQVRQTAQRLIATRRSSCSRPHSTTPRSPRSRCCPRGGMPCRETQRVDGAPSCQVP